MAHMDWHGLCNISTSVSVERIGPDKVWAVRQVCRVAHIPSCEFSVSPSFVLGGVSGGSVTFKFLALEESTMVRYLKPWNGTSGQLFDAFRREVDDLVGRIQDPSSWSDELASFAPRTNVAETDKQYEITLDLPGMKGDQFNIELHEGRLTVSGERTKEEAQEGKTFHRVERYFGKFSRTFNLGQDVDDTGVRAEYREGVLHVMIPKTTKAQPKRVQVVVS